jgi:pimeloyl-ACP methyl ester carboxylesterase
MPEGLDERHNPAHPGQVPVDRSMTLRTADGVRLAALHLPPGDGSAPAEPGAFVVVLAPGFSGWTEKPAVRAVADELRTAAAPGGLLLVDLRGHGQSSGRTTLGDREVLDVDAAIAAARSFGYARVVALGWSMGASCVLRHAALTGSAVHGHRLTEHSDAVVTVSAVSRWFVADTAAMRRLHRMVGTRLGRFLAHRLLHVRIDPAGWAEAPLPPVEAVRRIAVPMLFVHGDQDHYFGWEHAQALAGAAGRSAQLWLVPGLGHAEEAAVRPDVPGFLDRLGEALRDLAGGRPAPGWSPDRIPEPAAEPGEGGAP